MTKNTKPKEVPIVQRAGRMNRNQPVLNSIYGVIVIENTNSNPNGDPDREGEPRTTESLESLISAASLKRKLRDHVLFRTPTFLAIAKQLGITEKEIEDNYNIYVESSRTAQSYANEYAKDPEAFKARYWDARVFGNTLLGGKDGEDGGPKAGGPKAGGPKAGGPVFVSHIQSLQPVEVYTGTNTRAQGMSGSKSCDITPNSIRIVRYAVYTGKFGVSPDTAAIHGTTPKDIELFLALLPHAYSFKAANRTDTNIIQVWSIKKPLTLPLSHAKFAEITTPKFVGENPNLPATKRSDYKLANKTDVEDGLKKMSSCGEKLELTALDLA